MPDSFVQTGRPLTITTALGPDALIVLGVEGREAISELYRFEADVLAPGDPLKFDDLLGQEVTLTLAADTSDPRYLSGIVCAIEQTETVAFDPNGAPSNRYRLAIVPKLWLLSRRHGSRMFQQQTIAQILSSALSGCNARFELTTEYHPRDYCVQYRETDLNFVLRLMEEEGIYFFFRHTAGGHEMVVSDSPLSQPELDGPFLYEPVDNLAGESYRISSWRRTQEIRSGKCALWDSCFELPGRNLAAAKQPPEEFSSAAGKELELYDYPGGYASRFDGVNKSGGDQASDLQKIFEDNQRTVNLRMQADTASGIRITGRSGASRFLAGAKFSFSRHFSDDGSYLLTSVTHRSTQPLGTDSFDSPFTYENDFTCIPAALTFRPQRATPIPFVRGTQTALVVGPAGEEIFTDKYGRVKVQFPWDREGERDIDSSCWIRVATSWAGKGWGAVHIPRVGQEVIVAFEEGDPNQPIVIGSVYNAANMPPYTLPEHRTQSGVKTRSTPGGGGYNEIRFEDQKGKEQIVVHAEKDVSTAIGNVRETTIGQDDLTKIERGKSVTEAMESIEFKVGESSIKLDQQGITIKALNIRIKGTALVEIDGLTTKIQGESFLIAKGGMVLIN
jgi:type VI secretion system secreted protein VgrG